MKSEYQSCYDYAMRQALRVRLHSSEQPGHDKNLWNGLVEKLGEFKAEADKLIEAQRQENERLCLALRQIANPARFLRDKAMSDGKQLPQQSYLDRLAGDSEYLKYLAKKALE